MTFKPGKGKPYFMINSRFQVRETTNTGSQKSLDRIASGNAFKTKADAEQFQKDVLGLARYGAKRVNTQVGAVARVITWIAYLLLALILIALCCLVIDFIFWIFNINVTIFGVKL